MWDSACRLISRLGCRPAARQSTRNRALLQDVAKHSVLRRVRPRLVQQVERSVGLVGGEAEHLCKGLELLLEGVDSAVVVDVESDAEADGVQGGHGVGGVREQVRIKGEASPIVLLVPIHV